MEEQHINQKRQREHVRINGEETRWTLMEF